MNKNNDQIVNEEIFKNIEIEKVKNVSYIFFSGGTTSEPKMIPLSRNEWNVRSEYRAKCYENVGIIKGDNVAVLLPFGPWVAGSSVKLALDNLGCNVFPLGPLGNIEQIESIAPLLEKYLINIIITTPSYLQKIIKYLTKVKLKLSVDKIITSGEYVPNELRCNVSNELSAELFSSYASSEGFIGIECGEHSGYHYNPEKVFLEIKNNKNDEEAGPILVTIQDSEIIPIIRYEIGDVGFIDNSRCKCGLNWPRVYVESRNNEIFCLAGAVNVSVRQIQELIFKFNLSVFECSVIIDNNDFDQEIVNFEIKSNDSRFNKNKKIFKKEFLNLVESISIDFCDILYHTLIKVNVNLEYCSNIRHTGKSLIKIIDNRKYAR